MKRTIQFDGFVVHAQGYGSFEVEYATHGEELRIARELGQRLNVTITVEWEE